MKSDLSVLIVEDSVSYAIELERIVSSLGFNICAVVESSGDALEAIFFHEPDIILMDIQINGKMSGVEIAQKILHLDIPILYISSLSSNKVLTAAENTKMCGYLVKPVSETTLTNELNRIAAESLKIKDNGETSVINKANNSKSFLFKKKGLLKKIDFKDIICVEADDNYCSFTTEEDKFILRIKLSEVELKTKDHNFFRSHRTHIINLAYIVSFSKTESVIEMKHGNQAPLSRGKKSAFIELIKQL